MPLINRVLPWAAGGGKLPIYTGEYVIYGDEKQGWIEMLTSGVLTMPRALRRRGTDLYLLGSGGRGDHGTFVYETEQSGTASAGSGGSGGKYLEAFGVDLTGSHAVATGVSGASTVAGYSSNNGVSAAAGGRGAKLSWSKSASKVTVSQTAAAGGTGRRPFANNNPMSQGFSRYNLGAGGGGGGGINRVGSNNSVVASAGSGGNYGGGNGSNDGGSSVGRANTGSGGGGGYCVVGMTTDTGGSTVFSGTPGGSGIAIVRWGY